MATRRDFIKLLTGATLTGIVAGRGIWAQAVPIFQQDPHAALKAASLELYDVDGITVFPVYGADGGLCTKQAFYVIDRKSKRALGMYLNPMTTTDPINYSASAIRDAIKRFDEHSWPINLNGGSLGEPIEFDYKERA